MLQFRVLYREFLFRVVDLEILTPQGDIAAKPAGPEITLLDLATHHSGLPVMPDNLPFVAKRSHSGYRYSNLRFGLMGEALAHRVEPLTRTF